MVAQDPKGYIQWEVELAGPGKTLQRVAFSIAALSRAAWLSLLIIPSVAGGVLVQSGFISGQVGQIAYPVFCLCVWLALATIGGSYRSIRYRVDESDSQLLLARDGYDPEIDRASAGQNPAVPLAEIQSVTATVMFGHQIVRLEYGTTDFSKPDTIIVPVAYRSVWGELQQIQPGLPSLPPATDAGLLAYLRFALSVLVVGVLPLAVIEQQFLVQFLVVGFFVIAVGLLRNIIATVNSRVSDQGGSAVPQAVLGSIQTLVAIGTIIAIGYTVNILF